MFIQGESLAKFYLKLACTTLWESIAQLFIYMMKKMEKIVFISGKPLPNFRLALVLANVFMYRFVINRGQPLTFSLFEQMLWKKKTISKDMFIQGLRKYCTIVYIHDGNKNGKVVFIWGKPLPIFLSKVMGYSLWLNDTWGVMG